MTEVSGKLKLNMALDIIDRFPTLTIEEIKFRIDKEFLILRYDPAIGCILKYKGYEAKGQTAVEAVQSLRDNPAFSDELYDIFYTDEDEDLELIELPIASASSHKFKLR